MHLLAEVWSLEGRGISRADVSRSGGHGLPWAVLSESSAWHAPAARDAERPSAGKGGRKGASASKDRRSERFGFTGATKELRTEAAAAFQLMCFFVLYVSTHATLNTDNTLATLLLFYICVHFYKNKLVCTQT